ncbi:MAG: methionine--tRNA ligase [Deltaproteobacteria bacterium]|nr:methionine--tRNA ligase [Deltaproteobacteria bacterium]
MKKKKFYITTAIDYVNNLPHLGTAYEKIGADCIARLKRMEGFDVHFQMGSDEHSANVLKAANKVGLDPKKYCDGMRKNFEAVWKKLDVSYDSFVQTTSKEHAQGVQKLFQTIYDNGDIYKKPYEGWYCESCEAFYTEKDLENGLCPNHKNKPQWIKEENYFFRLSKYGKELLQHYKNNPSFIAPKSRRNEIEKFIENKGLEDISVSRSSVQWGIPVPFDKKHVVYVWFDALINYISGVGYPKKKQAFQKWWPADLHVIGKDITRFHCVIWPAMLLAAKIKLPKTVFGHGFVYLKGEKMSKSLGNIVDPMAVADQYGADPLRYYLLRTSSFGTDGDFTWDDFIQRYNGDLANGLGNLTNRTLGMLGQYQDGIILPQKIKKSALATTMTGIAKKVLHATDIKTGEIGFHDALAAIWEGITAQDQFINEKKPWVLNKEGKKEEIAKVLYEVCESIRITTILLKPFLPSTSQKIWKQFGFEKIGKWEKQTFKEAKMWNGITKKCQTKLGTGLFPRIETKETKKEETKMETPTQTTEGLLDISEFAKIDLRVAQILDAQKVEGADKLLKLQIDLGTEKRQIVAGIALHYTPQDLVGKKVCVVTNLKPAKIRGVDSNGMLLAASGGDTVSILTPLKDVPVGSKIK